MYFAHESLNYIVSLKIDINNCILIQILNNIKGKDFYKRCFHQCSIGPPIIRFIDNLIKVAC